MTKIIFAIGLLLLATATAQAKPSQTCQDVDTGEDLGPIPTDLPWLLDGSGLPTTGHVIRDEAFWIRTRIKKADGDMLLTAAGFEPGVGAGKLDPDSNGDDFTELTFENHIIRHQFFTGPCAGTTIAYNLHRAWIFVTGADGVTNGIILETLTDQKFEVTLGIASKGKVSFVKTEEPENDLLRYDVSIRSQNHKYRLDMIVVGNIDEGASDPDWSDTDPITTYPDGFRTRYPADPEAQAPTYEVRYGVGPGRRESRLDNEASSLHPLAPGSGKDVCFSQLEEMTGSPVCVDLVRDSDDPNRVLVRFGRTRNSNSLFATQESHAP